MLQFNRKVIFSLLIAMVTSIALVSCSKDDDKQLSKNSPIVGEWSGTYTYTYDGETFKESYIYSFKSDGTFTAKWWDGGINDFDPSDFGLQKGKYEYVTDLNLLTLNGVDEDGDYFSEYFSCTISGNKMIWIMDGDSLVFTRK